MNFDIDIFIAPIVREKDGLALSSRNIYLSETERKNARLLYQSLQYASYRIHAGVKSVTELHAEMEDIIQSGHPTQIDYIAFINPEKFEEVEILEPPDLLIALAVRFGGTRLIDNICIQLE